MGRMRIWGKNTAQWSKNIPRPRRGRHGIGLRQKKTRAPRRRPRCSRLHKLHHKSRKYERFHDHSLLMVPIQVRAESPSQWTRKKSRKKRRVYTSGNGFAILRWKTARYKSIRYVKRKSKEKSWSMAGRTWSVRKGDKIPTYYTGDTPNQLCRDI